MPVLDFSNFKPKTPQQPAAPGGMTAKIIDLMNEEIRVVEEAQIVLAAAPLPLHLLALESTLLERSFLKKEMLPGIDLPSVAQKIRDDLILAPVYECLRSRAKTLGDWKLRMERDNIVQNQALLDLKTRHSDYLNGLIMPKKSAWEDSLYQEMRASCHEVTGKQIRECIDSKKVYFSDRNRIKKAPTILSWLAEAQSNVRLLTPHNTALVDFAEHVAMAVARDVESNFEVFKHWPDAATALAQRQGWCAKVSSEEALQATGKERPKAFNPAFDYIGIGSSGRLTPPSPSS